MCNRALLDGLLFVSSYLHADTGERVVHGVQRATLIYPFVQYMLAGICSCTDDNEIKHT